MKQKKKFAIAYVCQIKYADAASRTAKEIKDQRLLLHRALKRRRQLGHQVGSPYKCVILPILIMCQNKWQKEFRFIQKKDIHMIIYGI